jgi:dipeptidyl aminopeptidase/acylaminoacyl peptidase
MRTARFTLLPVLVCALFASVRAEPPKKPEKPVQAGSKWTIDDVVYAESASDFQFSPDGHYLVWIKTTPDKDRTGHAANVIRTDLAETRDTELTRGNDTFSRPRWSPDGKRIALLSDRGGQASGKRQRATGSDDSKTQIWLIDPFGGEPWQLTEAMRGIQSFGWAGSEDIVFAAQEDPTWREKSLEDRKDTTTVVEDEKHEPPVRLFKVSAASGKITRLSDNTDRIEILSVSPDGKRAVTQHNRSLRYQYENRIKPVAYLYDLQDGQRKPIFANPKLNLSGFFWMPDSTGFYATDEFCTQPQFAQASVTELWHHDLATGKEQKIELAWPNGLTTQSDNDNAPGIIPVQDGFIVLLANGARNELARCVRKGDQWQRERLVGAHASNITGLQVSTDGKRMVYAYSTASIPLQWYQASLRGSRLGEPTELQGLNARYLALPKARTEVIRWKGAEDDSVEGILYYPHGYKEGKKYPLMVMIHGGPASLDMDSWDDTWASAPNLYCQRGAFVLRPNYHGSSNYGIKWLESITHGKYGDLEVIDIEKGVDHLIARGLVDPAKLGLVGWSNGAILTNLIIVQTTRYKAAASGAGVVEYVSDWANCSFGDAFDRYYLGKSPLEDPQLYHRKSAFWKFDKVRTPTLIFFGSEDRTVPTEQGWIHYRGLQQLAKTDVRFVLFPGAKHSLKQLAHKKRKLEEELAWFDRYLFKDEQSRNEALKRESPLAWMLERNAASKVKGRYGREVKDQLIPETVSYHGIEIGRFEVTAAQFAAFDPKFQVEPGKENHPASGISFEQAKAYCDWLSKLTGETYRLPDEDDAETLYDDSSSNENTLDYWAGHSVNPDDALRLREKLRELPGKAPLAREVGSFRGDGDAQQVFDLGGNVAEWTTDKNGKGVLMGGSADQPADSKQRSGQAAPEYRGFRVVFERK